MDYEGICSLTIAGPGAGKTTKMVELIEQSLQNLEPNRFCAVITYTNEATKEIKRKLEQRTKIPANLFIGTLHSFLIKFIFEPYAHLYNITHIDKTYIDEVKLNFEIPNPHQERNYIKTKAEELLQSGLVTYDQILDKSYLLISNDRLCSIVANRLQYVFIDEYQDSRLLQHKIILKILHMGKTDIYAIGDPMQSIFYFTYSLSQLRNEPKPDDENLPPIIELKKICTENDKFKYNEENNNYRCSPRIVSFINRFNACIMQKANKDDNGVPVFYINSTDLNEIIAHFFSLKQKYNITRQKNCSTIESLFLSKKRATFEPIAADFGLREISYDTSEQNMTYSESSKCVHALLGITMKQLKEKYEIDTIAFRKFVIKTIKEVQSQNYGMEDIPKLKKDIIISFNREFDLNIPLATESMNYSIDRSLKRIFFNDPAFQDTLSFYSTIHSAKGLQASSVLVVAETKSLFAKWLKTNTTNILDHDNDSARLGFVAFSRAIDFLCVGCLQETFNEIEYKLQDLNVEIYPPLTGNGQMKLTDF